MLPFTELKLSGDRIGVIYKVTANAEDIESIAVSIAIEQTIEFPLEYVQEDDIRKHIVGQVREIKEVANSTYNVHIDYAAEVTSWDLVSFLNMIIGNSSMHSGIRVENVVFCDSFLDKFRGPRFGVGGVRARTGVSHRPLLCGALKPIGLSAQQLAEAAYEMAIGGVDLIKDDHGLINQPFAPAEDRIRLCSQAVVRANQETGRQCLYFTNVTGSADKIPVYTKLACESGAGGLMIVPGLVGFDTMRAIAETDGIGLPLMNHPSFQGFYIQHAANGMSPRFVWGQLARLIGSDLSAFPHFRSRFAYTREMCADIIDGCQKPMGQLKPALPTIGGGIRFDTLAEVFQFYRKDVAILVGGDLHTLSSSVRDNAEKYARFIETQF
jgi:ribulose-bisphosphate carboxylase large chain